MYLFDSQQSVNMNRNVIVTQKTRHLEFYVDSDVGQTYDAPAKGRTTRAEPGKLRACASILLLEHTSQYRYDTTHDVTVTGDNCRTLVFKRGEPILDLTR